MALPLARPDLEFFVAGDPGTKGSVNAFIVGKGRRRRAVVVNNSKKAKPWAEAIATSALAAMNGRELFDCAVTINIEFYLPRPKSHFGKSGLKPSAPSHSVSRPDGDKLERCAWDALTGGVFTDDARIVRWSGTKLYADKDKPLGAKFTITKMTKR